MLSVVDEERSIYGSPRPDASLTITAAAVASLKDLMAMLEPDVGRTLRLVVGPDADVNLVLDGAGDMDRVVYHADLPVMSVQFPLPRPLWGKTLDTNDSSGVPELTLL